MHVQGFTSLKTLKVDKLNTCLDATYNETHNISRIFKQNTCVQGFIP
jgi:hypothetical protein